MIDNIKHRTRTIVESGRHAIEQGASILLQGDPVQDAENGTAGDDGQHADEAFPLGFVAVRTPEHWLGLFRHNGFQYLLHSER